MKLIKEYKTLAEAAREIECLLVEQEITCAKAYLILLYLIKNKSYREYTETHNISISVIEQ